MFRLSALQFRGGTYHFHPCSSFYSNIPRNHTLQWNRGIFWYSGRGKVWLVPVHPAVGCIFTAPRAVILVVVEQLVVGQASLLYNLVVGEVDFAEAVADFHVEDVTGNVCDIAAEGSDNLAHLVRRCANDCRNLTVCVLAVFQRVQTIHVIVLDGVRVFARSGSKVTNCVFDTYDSVLHFCTLTFFFRGAFTAPVL